MRINAHNNEDMCALIHLVSTTYIILVEKSPKMLKVSDIGHLIGGKMITNQR